MSNSKSNNGHIYCADCAFCKRFRSYNEEGTQFVFKVKCTKGRWRYLLGDEKYYDAHRVFERRKVRCKFYESMSGNKAEVIKFIKELKARATDFQKVYQLPTFKERS